MNNPSVRDIQNGGAAVSFSPSEQAVLKLYNRKSKMNFQFWAIFCWVVVWPTIGYCFFYPIGWEELHTISLMMLMGMICWIFHLTKQIIVKYETRISELERR